MLNYGAKNIIVFDSVGAIYLNRPNLNEFKKHLAKTTNIGCLGKNGFKCEMKDMVSAIKDADIFIGVSAPGILTQEMVKTMSKKAIIFAMANPVPEIMPNIAKKAGAYIIATGRSDFPNQINNVLAFPGVFRGALDNKINKITDEMKIKAAENLAKIIKKPSPNKIIPSVFDKKVVKAVAKAIKN